MKNTLLIIVISALVVSPALAELHFDTKARIDGTAGKERQQDASDTVIAAKGKEFVISMDANVTTGYQWQLERPAEDGLITLVSSKYLPLKTGLVGSGGRSVWTFKAVRPGKARISFKYVRPWEKGIPPIKKAEYIIDIRE